MNNGKQALKVSIIFLLAAAVGCAGTRSAGKKEAVAQDTSYWNAEYGFGVTFPPGWTIFSKDEWEAAIQEGKALATKKEAAEEVFEAAREVLTKGFVIANPIDSPDSVVISFIPMDFPPGEQIPTGAEVIQGTEEQLERIGMSIVSRSTTTATLGGIAFDVLALTMQIQGDQVQQRQYVARFHDRRMLIIQQTFGTAREQRLGEGVLKTLRFE